MNCFRVVSLLRVELKLLHFPNVKNIDMLSIILTEKMGLLHWNARRLFNFRKMETAD